VEFRNQNSFPIPSLRGNWPKHRNHYLAAVDDAYALNSTTLFNARVSPLGGSLIDHRNSGCLRGVSVCEIGGP
jgi:hypothetical protein